MKITAALISYVLVVAFATSCLSSDKKNHDGDMFVKAVPYRTATGWGYEIYADDSLYIRQPFIPSVAGRYSFASQQDAVRTANLAIQKMERLHRMPHITKQDLDTLHIRIPD